MKKDLENKEYYLGLDCGTSSVGFAVTDLDYNLLKFNGKAMWGSHLFDEAKPAAERRVNRCARRRRKREVQRLSLLQEIFAEPIYKVDPTFFIRLNDSKYLAEDKHYNDSNIIFNDKDYKDRDFFRQFPTSYHLRKYLIKEGTQDPRLLYLGIHHILKHRGHFLFPGDNMSAIINISPLVEELKELYRCIYECELFFTSNSELENALKEKNKPKKRDLLNAVISSENAKFQKYIVKLLMGDKLKVKDLFDNEEYDQVVDVEFKSNSFELVLDDLMDALTDDEFKFIEILKGMYDWALLADIMKGKEYISESKIALYEQNKKDLTLLKKVIKRYVPNEYKEFFHSNKAFSAYIGKSHNSNGKKIKVEKSKRINIEEFYKQTNKILDKCDASDNDVVYLKNAIQNDSLLPMLMSFRNGVIPYQVNKIELDAILLKAKENFSFLQMADSDGITANEKIKSLMTYRIPYYVGPLGSNNNSSNSFGWLVRKEAGRILPWNLDQKVDIEQSAENFILRMTNKCTYCKEEDVLPRQSIAYSKYLVLSELNNLSVKGERLSVDLKQSIYRNLFQTKKKVTKRDIVNFLIKEGYYEKGDISKEDLTGIDTDDFKSSLGAYIDFKKYIDEKRLNKDDVDLIVKWITLFSDGGDILKKRISKHFSGVLTDAEVNSICKKKYTGWGRFSHKFLYEITATNYDTSEYMSIVRMMWNTQFNLMELLSKNFEYKDQVSSLDSIKELDYEYIDELYVSPSVKRQIWQTMRIVDEIVKIMKHPPKKVFIETTRSDGEKGKRTVSRRDDLLSKVKEALKSNSEYHDEFNKMHEYLTSYDDSQVSRQDKLFLYLSQCGRCMYSGEQIKIEDLYRKDESGNNLYDVDHIYPISKSNDDSLQNKVLVKSVLNRKKTDIYPLSDSVRGKMNSFWKMLKDKQFITQEKYNRLVRNTPLTQEELKGFINRQLVETSQSTKASAEILKRYFGNDTKIVYSKARNVSEFRNDYELIKCRSLNDLHHAKDAYLNIVVGNVFDTKYTEKYYLQMNGKGYYNLSEPFKHNVSNAWEKGEEGTIATVRSVMRKNNVLLTRQPVEKGGALYDLNLVAKGSKGGALPSKTTDPGIQKMIANGMTKEQAYEEWTNKYGGYNSLTTAYFSLVKYKKKKDDYAAFVPISIVDSKELADEDKLRKYCAGVLKCPDVEIIRSKVLSNTLLIFDGFQTLITGKSNMGKTITLSSNIPLILSEESQKVLKKVESFLKKLKDNKNLVVDPIHDELDDSKFELLYSELIEKSNASIYKDRPGSQIDLFQKPETRDKFMKLSLNDKCKVISEFMRYYGCGSGLANFEAIGGTKACGTITKSSSINLSKTKLTIVDKSITGLFENRINID